MPPQASRVAGVPIDQPSWFYPGGGWMRPAALARAWLSGPGRAFA